MANEFIARNGLIALNNTIITGSFNVSGSLNADSTLYVTGSRVGIGTTSPSYSLDVSGSARITNGLTITGSLNVLGTASINTLVVNQTEYSSGSNQLGDNQLDTQTLYGNVIIPTGSLVITGSKINGYNITASGLYSSAEGTSDTILYTLQSNYIYLWNNNIDDGIGTNINSLTLSSIVVNGNYSYLPTPFIGNQLDLSDNAGSSISIISGSSIYSIPIVSSITYNSGTDESTLTLATPLNPYYLYFPYGNQLNSYGYASHAEGFQSISSGSYSHAEGFQSVANGLGSHAEGSSTNALGILSHAEGLSTYSSGSFSHTEGRNTIVGFDPTSGNWITGVESSHAEGRNVTVFASNAHGEGQEVWVGAESAHGEGYYTKTFGFAAHGEGYYTIASGSFSHAEGQENISYGIASHAEGFLTTASGDYSHTEGIGTIALGYGQTVQGFYNIPDPSYFWILGNGSDKDNRRTLAQATSNEFHITGTLIVKGDNDLSYSSNFQVITGNGTGIADFKNSGFLMLGTSQISGSNSGFITRYSSTVGPQIVGYNYGDGTSPSYKPIFFDTDGVGRNKGVFINYSASQQPTVTEFGVKGQGATFSTYTAKFQNSNLANLLTIQDDGTSTFNTSSLFISSSGQIGVNTTDPSLSGAVNSRFTVNQIDANTGYALANGTSKRMAINGNSNGSFTFYDGSGNVWNSGLTQFGGKIGIGASIPTASLDIRVIQTAAGGFGRTVLISSSLSASANSDILVGLDIDTSLNTGSFTNVSNYALRVAGNAAANTGDYAGIASFRNNITTSGTNPSYVFRINRQNSAVASWYFGVDGNADGILVTNNANLRLGRDTSGTFTEFMRMVTSGNFILQNGGTFTDNGYRFQINSGGSTSGSLYISGSSSQNLLQIDSPVSSSILFVTGSGRVGIGTNNPATTVHVVQASSTFRLTNSTNNYFVDFGFPANSGGEPAISMYTTGITAGRIFQRQGTTNTVYIGDIDANNGAVMFRSNGNDAFKILTNGNVLFQTNGSFVDAGYKLDVSGSGRFTNTLTVTGSLGVNTGTGTPSKFVGDYVLFQNTNGATGTGYSIELGTNSSTPRMDFVVNSQYVGQFSSAGNDVNFKNNLNNLGAINFTTKTGSVETTRIKILNNGSVGIGTTTPSYTLDVSGSGRFTNTLTVTGSTIVKGTGTTSATTTLNIQNANASSSLLITDDLNSRFLGKVGIGIFPTASFQISASAGTSSALYIYKSGSTTVDIQGSQGQLFSVTDNLTGSLMSVNDVSGLPILEVSSDDKVVMGTYGAPGLTVSGSSMYVPTASTPPTGGREGEFKLVASGGSFYVYGFIGGAWRSGSLF